MKYFIVIFCILLILLMACENNLLENIDQKISEEDDVPPEPGGNGNITLGDIQADSITVSWTKATDNASAQSKLEYKVVYSESDNINTVANAENNGTTGKAWTADIDTAVVTGLTDLTTYYVNVIVKDVGGNKEVYTTNSDDTPKQQRLFWAENSTERIFRVNLDGTNKQTEELNNLDQPWGIALDIDARKIYWTDHGASGRWIRQSDINGSNGIQVTIVSGLTDPLGIEIDTENNYVYWVDNFTQAIYAVSTLSTGQSLPASPLVDLSAYGKPYDLALDLENGKIYWTERDYYFDGINCDRIGVVDMDFSNPTPVPPPGTEETFTFITNRYTANLMHLPTGIEYDSENEMLYWLENSGDCIYDESINRTNMSMSTENLFSGQVYFGGAKQLALNADSGIMYWTNNQGDAIYYANMDGSGSVEELMISGSPNAPNGIALDL